MLELSNVQINDISTEAWQKRAKMAFSVDEIEARCFNINPCIENTDIWKSEFLSKLALECLTGALPNKVSISNELDTEDFLLHFKSAVSFLGSNVSFWESLATLVRLPEHSDEEAIHSELALFYLYSFGAESDWFGQDFDWGFMLLDMEGKYLAVLAVTFMD